MAFAEKTENYQAYPVQRSHTELCSKEWNSCIIWFQTNTFLQDFNSSSRLLKTFSIEITKSIHKFHKQKIPISIIYFSHFVDIFSQLLIQKKHKTSVTAVI